MKRFLTASSALLCLCLVSVLLPAQAQTAATRPESGTLFRYDRAQEVTISGTVASVLRKPATGMIMGAHLVITTPSGEFDASLGRFGLTGKGSVVVAAGQQVELTGVMRTMRDKPILLTRLVKVGGEVYTVRTEHGVELSPQARQRANGNTGLKGESL